MLDELKYIAHRTYAAIRRQKLYRNASSVESEYSDGWNQYWDYLKRANSLEEWLFIKGFEGEPGFYNIGQRLTYEAFDYTGYYRSTLADAIVRHFPDARSVTEYGCGVGRNLLYLKQHFPKWQLYGYELCEPGVEIARKAAEKFGIDVKYSQLDYVSSAPDKYVFPATEVGFTMFSLEQLPRDNKRAVQNILAHVVSGSLHMEPVPENYPLSYRGLIGKLEHWKVDYLQDFDTAVRSLGLKRVTVERLASAHNALMFPSLYILEKK